MDNNEVELDQLRVSEETTRARQQAASVERSGRALCLSGGGFRAALFHLGGLLRMHQTGHLADVGLFSSVSGGSIVSAWLACRFLQTRSDAEETFAQWCRRIEFRQVVVEPFRSVAGSDIRTAPVLATLPWNWLVPSVRVEMLQQAYARIYGKVALHDLPQHPRFEFCATDVTFGVHWVFSKRRIGDYLAGYLRETPPIALAAAVAASSCFPPLFGPVAFAARSGDFHRGRATGEAADRLRRRIELSDGGVYDNLGMEPALRRYREVLVSDAGAPFAFVPGRHYLRRLLRYTEVIGNQAVALRKRLLFGMFLDGGIDGSYWNLHDRGDPGRHGYSPTLVDEVIARVRTDLDRFDATEFEVLVNHGYFACENAIGRAGKPADGGAAADWPYPARADEAAVRRALAASHRRFRPRRWWRG